MVNISKPLTTADETRQIKLWDLARTKESALLTAQPSALTSVQFSPRRNHYLATADRNGCVTLRDTSTQIVLTTLKHPEALHSPSFSPDGTQLATAGTSGKISLWDLATEEQTLLNHDYPS